MSTLKETTRLIADDLRDGIPWVAVYKVGRSWKARSFWLDYETDLFKPSDLDDLFEIMFQDPNAVLLNGYYCGRIADEYGRAPLSQIEAAIFWHYESGFNRLADSPAWPAGEGAA